MMSKYIIRARNYDGHFYDCEFKYQWFILALVRLIMLRLKYDLVEFEYRD